MKETLKIHLKEGDAEQISEIQKKLFALAWENFLKLRANQEKKGEANKFLMAELNRYSSYQGVWNDNLPLLDGDYEKSYQELKAYQKDPSDPPQTRFAQLLGLNTFPQERKVYGSESEKEKAEEAAGKYYELESTVAIFLEEFDPNSPTTRGFREAYHNIITTVREEIGEADTYNEKSAIYTKHIEYLSGLIQKMKAQQPYKNSLKKNKTP